jgi:hypothetical protein
MLGWTESVPMRRLRQGGRTHVVVMLCIEDGQGIATPVPHQLHPRSRLLNAEPKLTDGRGDFKHSSIGKGFDNADYKACVGPAESSCVICALASTHFGNVLVQMVLGHIHRSQMYDAENRWIQGEYNITRKVGKPRHLGTGRIMVADLVKVYGSIVGVGTFYGYQCPVGVGVFVLGASEEGDSDVNVWVRFSKARTVRVHIH